MALLVADRRAGWVALAVLAGLARVVWMLMTGARNGRSRAAEKGYLRGPGSLVFRLALPGAARPGAILGDLGVGCPPPGCSPPFASGKIMEALRLGLVAALATAARRTCAVRRGWLAPE